MPPSSTDINKLKKDYEAALVNEAHSQWTIDTASLATRMFSHDRLLHEEDLRQKYVEEARQIAVRIHQIDPDQGMQITTDIERDVSDYMERRKAGYDKK